MAQRPTYNAAQWKRIRQEVLERDGRQCQIRLERCTGTATCVDHIVPYALGDPDSYLDPFNLRAACRYCNSALGARLTNERKKSGRSKPAAGYSN